MNSGTAVSFSHGRFGMGNIRDEYDLISGEYTDKFGYGVLGSPDFTGTWTSQGVSANGVLMKFTRDDIRCV